MKTCKTLIAVLVAALMVGVMAGSAFAADYTLTAEDEVIETGSLIPAWASKGVSSEFVIGVDVAGTEITGNLAEVAEVIENDVVYITDINVNSELGDSINDKGAFNTTFLYANGGEADTYVMVEDSTFVFSDNSDGKNANDFTGAGVVFVATGAEDTETALFLENVSIETDGFGRDAVVVDAYANALVKDSTIITKGSNPLTESYEGYASTAAQAYMISPPWILGIYGGVRAANVLGKYSSFTLIDSVMETGGWAVISTDDCTSPTVNVVNSTLACTEYDGEDPTFGTSSTSMNGGAALFGYEKNYGSAYGTYNIGSSYEYFYGTTFEGTTYTTILTGAATTYYGASYAGLVLYNEMTGEELITYDGEGQPTVVNGVFGTMDHQGASMVILDEGSIWNTEEAVMLVRGAQNSTYVVSGAEMNPNSGIIFQMMDDDDGYGTSGAGGDTSGEQGFAKWDTGAAWGMPTFSSGFSDPNEAGFVAPSEGGSYKTSLTLTTGAEGEAVEYTGDIYNGTGTGAGTNPGGLKVVLDGEVTLNGAISSTSAVHGLVYNEGAVEYLDALAERYGEGVAPNGGEACTVKYALIDAEGNITEDEAEAAFIQILEFTINEYYIISHVVNMPMAGANVLVVVGEGSVWNVTSDSYITGLVNLGEVNVAEGVKLIVNGEEYDGTSEEAGIVAADGSAASIDTSAWVVGDNYRAEATGNYAEVTIDDNLYYIIGATEAKTGAAVVNVAFDLLGWLEVAEDGTVTISEEYVAAAASAAGGSGEGESAGGEGGEGGEGESAGGEGEGESAAEEAPAGEVNEDSYKAFLKEACTHISAIEANIEEFYAAIDAGNYVDFPADMLFQDTFFGYALPTLEEYLAAGGNVEIPDYDPTLSADAEE